MLKVLIADDEKKICRLIEMLCDWEKLNMQVIGNAYNGIEVMEKIEELKPDIVILDIKMPGCSGIEVVKKIAENNIAVQIVIISGYAEFEYAQAAIKYGVSNYLLKPIKKNELEETLSKLSEECYKKKEQEYASYKLEQYRIDENLRRRRQYFEEIKTWSGRQSREEINREYAYSFVEGFFRIVIVKAHCAGKKQVDPLIWNAIEKYEEAIKKQLEKVCSEIEIFEEENNCYIVCNYVKEKKEQFEEELNRLVQRLAEQRFRMWEANFSLAMGEEVGEIEKISDSLKSAVRASKEVLIRGCEKILQPPVTVEAGDFSDLIKEWNSRFERAIELYDEKAAREAADGLREKLETAQGAAGEDIFHVVQTIGGHVIALTCQADSADRTKEFYAACDLCGSIKEILGVLGEEIASIICQAKERNKNEERKPVRLAKQYMADHYTEALTLEEVSDVAGFSSGYFSSLFKKEVGIGFNEYLVKIRMEEAKRLLKRTDMNIKDICTRVGYQDIKHFNSTFRKYAGLKPGEYRKLYN